VPESEKRVIKYHPIPAKPHYNPVGGWTRRSPPVSNSGTGITVSHIPCWCASWGHERRLTTLRRRCPTLGIYPRRSALPLKNVKNVTRECHRLEHKPGVRKGHHCAQRTLTIGYLPRMYLRLSDRSSFFRMKRGRIGGKTAYQPSHL